MQRTAACPRVLTLVALTLLSSQVLSSSGHVEKQGGSNNEFLRVRSKLTSSLREAVSRIMRDPTASLDTCSISIDPDDKAYRHLFLSQKDLQVLDSMGISYSIIQDEKNSAKPEVLASSSSFTVDPSTSLPTLTTLSTTDWPLGSAQGFFTLDEADAMIKKLASDYPETVQSVTVVGTTYEKRPIYSIRISSKENAGGRPAALYTALHHAREPASLTTVLYFMTYLCEQAREGNPEVSYLLSSRDLYFMPIVNPDGYHYNLATFAPDNRFHRKNRAPECLDGTRTGQGVDLNRNYAFKWGLDDVGSSDITCSEVYRGKSPMSEAETQAVRNVITSSGEIRIAINFHSYGNLLLFPYGYAVNAYPPESDLELMRVQAKVMTEVNRYDTGTGWEILYTTNGGSDDYMYREFNIFAMTAEVGTATDGFWPPASRILPIARDNVELNLRAARSAGFYLRATLQEWTLAADGKTVAAKINLQNIGRHSTDSQVDFSFESVSVDGSAQVAVRGGTQTLTDRMRLVQYVPRLGSGYSAVLNVNAIDLPDRVLASDGSVKLHFRIALSGSATSDLSSVVYQSVQLEGKVCRSGCGTQESCDLSRGICLSKTGADSGNVDGATDDSGVTVTLLPTPEPVDNRGDPVTAPGAHDNSRSSRGTVIAAIAVVSLAIVACLGAIVLGVYRRHKDRSHNKVITQTPPLTPDTIARRRPRAESSDDTADGPDGPDGPDSPDSPYSDRRHPHVLELARASSDASVTSDFNSSLNSSFNSSSAATLNASMTSLRSSDTDFDSSASAATMV